METYITLTNGTPTTENPDTAKALEKANCKLIGQYMLFGQYDYIVIFQAPDAASAAMGVYYAKEDAGIVGSPSQTMRAFDASDMEKFQAIGEKNA